MSKLDLLKSKNLNPILLHLIVFTLIFSFALLGKYLYFRDYSIIWEGAYRINQGQLPYKDFGIPMGPGVFILPSIYQFLFGYSFDGILYCGLIVQCLSYFAFYKIFSSFKFNFIELIGFSLVFVLSYLLNFKYMWYNSFALMLMLFLVYFCLNIQKHYLYSIFSGLFVFLSLITKQDYGALSLIFYTSFLFYLVLNKQFKTVLISISALALPSSFFILYFKTHDLFYWFNYGQPYFQSRFHRLNFNTKHFNYFGKNEFEFHQHSIDETIVYSVIMSLILFFHFLFNRKIKSFSTSKILVGLFFVFSAYITSRLSGLSYFSTGYYWVFATLIAYTYISSINPNVKWINYLFIFVMSIFILLKAPIRYFKIIDNQPLYYDYTPIDIKSYKGNNYESTKLFGRTYLLSNIHSDIDTLKLICKKHQCKNMLNMTELTPLYPILNMPLTTKLPLWYDPSTCLLDREKYMIIEDIKKRKYDLILIQNTHNYIEEYKNTIIEQYKLIYFFKTSSDVNDVFVYIKS